MQTKEFKPDSKLTAEEAVKMLKKQGMEVTVEQAAEILAFMRKLANIAVSNYLKSKDTEIQ